MVKIQQLDFQIFEIITLGPMVRVCIQITQKVAVGFPPVRERFTCRHPIARAYRITFSSFHGLFEATPEISLAAPGWTLAARG